eukprot:1510086-Amphidinium_carterae.1
MKPLRLRRGNCVLEFRSRAGCSIGISTVGGQAGAESVVLGRLSLYYILVPAVWQPPCRDADVGVELGTLHCDYKFMAASLGSHLLTT